ncbi:MAG TPA: epoxyalkane--coenzyme M transferase [Trebonia sp.]|jgi:5-methyltetrahydropteroyltriglutamate--homocysteine methyltransferase|nr:epoxyalkane--coenzyme M transferase [Trebonia sp.]
MRHSTDGIRSTHGGNLPRPARFDALLQQGKVVTAEVAEQLPGAVQWVVDRQLDCGVSVINDGEYVKAAGGGMYSGYIHQRVSGWEVQPVDHAKPRKRGWVGGRERAMFPGFWESGLWLQGSGGPVRPGFFTPGAPAEKTTERVATGPLAYTGQAAIKADTDALAKALAGKPATTEGFVAALGPLSLGAGARNEYYSTEEEYMMAVAEVMRAEYKAITDAGFIVQVDEPEFATAWQFYPDWDVARYREYLELCVEVINHALEGLPEDQVRFHMCWGSGHRPHVTDIDLVHIADLIVKVNAQAYAIEAGNARHAHEWTVWRDVKLPDGKILVPGVISHATDLVEAPGLVAERLVNFASVVGKENVQAGTDCGIGSRVGHEEIVWAKLASMAQGAEMASKQLWGR